jgi:transcriptional repressor of cell division inhibition gene dicB
MRKKAVIKKFGSAAALARALGITRQSVHDWPDEIPEGRQYQLEILTNGELKAQRPPTAERPS